MQWKKVLFSTIIGIILFITEFNFGWMSFALGGLWAIFIIVFIAIFFSKSISICCKTYVLFAMAVFQIILRPG